MIKHILVFLLCFYTSSVWAKCPLADAYLKAGKTEFAWDQYVYCADQLNDYETQVYVGKTYLDGSSFVPQSLQNAFKYFRTGAESGYAPAQRELAKLIDALEDMGSNGENALIDFEKRFQKKDDLTTIPLSALAWMTLAAEKKENKWFYDVPAIADAEAIQLLPKFMSKQNIEQAEKQAVAFKQKKLMQQARKLLSDSAYQDFEAIIYPDKQKGKVKGRMTKAQAVENLRQYKMSIQK